MDLDPGTVIDRYVIERPLGRGGMAVVYQVQHTLLRSTHALKVLTTTSAQLAESLLREGRVQAALRHPNVLAVTDLVTVRGSPGLVLDYIPGPTLTAFQLAQRPSTTQAATIALGIVRGVSAAHAAGVVHRDLKPSNVMLDPRGGRLVTKVADFGLVKLIDEVSPARGIQGTPAYMAPEQARGDQDIDHRADFFALGAVLYELFVGERAFTGPSGQAVMRAVRSGAPLAQMNRLPNALTPQIRALLRVSPDARPTTLDDLEDALESLSDPKEEELLARTIGWTHTAEVDFTEMGHTTDPSSRTLDLDSLAHEPFVMVVPQLPDPGPPLLGREKERAAIEDELRHGSLVTLLGPGGCGKSRLALDIAHRSTNEGIASIFVELAKVRDRASMRTAVATALDCPEGSIEQALTGRAPMRVVLDNLEQIIGPGAELAGAWSRIRGVQLIVTSRERLRVANELVIDLGSLSEEAAVSLFQERAAASGHAPSEEDLPVVREIVNRVDRMPLAIELAAARARTVALERLLSRLDDHLRTLRGRRGSERQSSLEGALDWSWDLLDDDERALFCQCGVFRGSFDLEMAEATAALGEGVWVDELLDGLVDKSLVRRLPSGRYGLFMTVRAYARARLDAEVEQGARTRRAHYLAEASERQTDGLEMPSDAGAFTTFLAQLDEMRAIVDDAAASDEQRGWALAGLFASARVPWSSPLVELADSLESRTPHRLAIRLRHAVLQAQYHRGEVDSLEERVTALIASAGSDFAVRGSAERLLGRLWQRAGRTEDAEQLWQSTSAQADALGAYGLYTDIALSRASHAWSHGDLAECERILVAAQERVAGRDPSREMRVVHNLGVLRHDTGAVDEAEAAYRRAIEVNAELQDQSFAILVTENLATLLHDRGALDQAVELHREAAGRAASIGRVIGEAIALGNLGNCLLELGREDDAEDAFRRAQAIARRAKEPTTQGYYECSLAQLAYRRGQPERVRAHIATSTALFSDGSDPRGQLFCHLWACLLEVGLGDVELARTRLDSLKPEDDPVTRRLWAIVLASLSLAEGGPIEDAVAVYRDEPVVNSDARVAARHLRGWILEREPHALDAT